MNVSLTQAIDSLSPPGAELRSKAPVEPTAAQEQVASQFEGLFISLLLKELRESLDEGMFGGEHSDTYGVMFDQFLGDHLAEQGGLGLRNEILSRISTSAPQGHQS